MPCALTVPAFSTCALAPQIRLTVAVPNRVGRQLAQIYLAAAWWSRTCRESVFRRCFAALWMLCQSKAASPHLGQIAEEHVPNSELNLPDSARTHKYAQAYKVI
jgi:hypothetical protein